MDSSIKKNKDVHGDMMGNIISIDAFVAYPNHNSLEIGQVVKINSKMIRIRRIPASRYKAEYLKYPNDLLLVDSSAVSWWLLKNSK